MKDLRAAWVSLGQGPIHRIQDFLYTREALQKRECRSNVFYPGSCPFYRAELYG